MVGQMDYSTKDDRQSAPGRVFGIVLDRHRAVSLAPFPHRETRELRKQFAVHFLPKLSLAPLRMPSPIYIPLVPELIRAAEQVERVEGPR